MVSSMLRGDSPCIYRFYKVLAILFGFLLLLLVIIIIIIQYLSSVYCLLMIVKSIPTFQYIMMLKSEK